MVRMIPEVLGEVESATEAQLYETFKSIKGKPDWTIIHSQELANVSGQLQGEVDFIVFIPGKGIVVVECKGATSVTINGNNWTLEGVPTAKKFQNPFKQADNARRSIYKLLKQAGYDVERKTPIARLVWLPRITANKVFQTGGEFRIEELALKAELDDPAKALMRCITAQIDSKRGDRNIKYEPESLTADVLQSYINVIHVQIELDADLNSLEAERRALVNKSTDQNRYLVDMVGRNDWLFFDGPAGSGKTVMLTDLAIKWSKEDRKVLYLCYNEMLAEQQKKFFEGRPNVTVASFNELLLRLAGLKKNPAKSTEDWFSRVLPELALKCMTETNYFPEFQAVCIDEFQDIVTRPLIFTVVTEVLDGTSRPAKMAVAADDNQQIQTNAGIRLSSYDFLTRESIPFPYIFLNINCRQSPKLHRAIDQLLGRKSEVTRHLLPEHTEGGLEVIATTEERQTKDLYKVIQKYLKTYKPENIRVLSPHATSSALGKLTSQYDVHSRELRELKKLTDYPQNGGTIHWRSIPKYKGLEDDVIIITDISAASKVELQERGQSLEDYLYVGLSRARFRAVVLVQDDLFPASK